MSVIDDGTWSSTPWAGKWSQDWGANGFPQYDPNQVLAALDAAVGEYDVYTHARDECGDAWHYWEGPQGLPRLASIQHAPARHKVVGVPLKN
eukprot:11208728-Lingulodinium_polyedra.AAC.2